MNYDILPLPPKRTRTTFNGNGPFTECIHEFKLPQLFPSMASKSTVGNDTKIRNGFNQITNLSHHPNFQQKKETTLLNKTIRKIKLKDTTGRELGEVNVEDLPQNIQGKTITLAKNGSKIIMSNSTIDTNEKPVMLGVLTPINVQNTNGTISYSLNDPKNSSLKCIAAMDQTKVEQSDPTKLLIQNKKDALKVRNKQGPKVLVYQTGKNWHMVKLGPARTEKKVSVIQRIRTTVLKEETQSSKSEGQESTLNLKRAIENVSNNFSSGVKLTKTRNRPAILVQKLHRKSTEIDSKERVLSPGEVEQKTTKPMIEISRIFSNSNCKNVLQPIAMDSSSINLLKVTRNAKTLPSTSNTNLQKNVMVVLPRNVPSSCYNEMEKEDTQKKSLNLNNIKNTSTELLSETYNADIKINNYKIQKLSNNDSEVAKYIDSPEFASSSREKEKKEDDENDAERKEELTNGLCIVGKALSMVDHELRAKALKALADCGIGVEKLVPITAPTELKSVKDSQTQTSIFGVLDRKDFVSISDENTNIQRIPIRERSSAQSQNLNHIIGNPHSQELIMFNRPDRLNSPLSNETEEMVEGFLEGNEGASNVKAIFARTDPLRAEIMTKFQEDCRNCTEYDENGLLDIHKAVITDNLSAVKRFLMVLRATQQSTDLPTLDGQTSLELAIRYQSSETIVRTLLNAGADPASESGHDSALIIASKKSLPILSELITYTTKCINLDKCDSTGFSALHYCSQIGNLPGATDLVRASANINLRDRRSGRTALFHAIENKHNELSKMLIENGAQSNITNFSGQTVLSLIDDNNYFLV